MKTKIIFTVCFVAITVMAFPQVGINNSQPHSSSVLDLSGAENRTSGLIIPQIRVDSVGVDGKLLVKTPRANGLLVFDSINSEFYFWQQSDNQWYALNRWKANGTNTNRIYTDVNDSVGIGTSTPTQKLDVNGNMNTTGSITATGNINTSAKVQEDGNDLIPAGTIVMWSGTTIPNGWALCDGGTYNGYTVPDLKDKFVLGASSMAQVGGTGGSTTVTLEATNLPQHSHSISGDPSHDIYKTYRVEVNAKIDTDGSNKSYLVNDGGSADNSETMYLGSIPAHNHGGNTGTGSGLNQTPISIPKPPYIILAFIIKLP